MTDLVQKLVGALETFVERFKDHEDAGPRGETWQSDEFLAELAQARSALSEAKAGGWVAVQGEPWGWAIVSNDGTTQATRARIRDFLGSHMEMPPYMQAEIAQVDREWAGLAPHRVVTLYALPAPPAQRGEG